jgi:hypothetical protein
MSNNNNVERGGCRFILKKTGDDKPLIVMEPFHQTVSRLVGITLSLEVLGGITPEQTRDLVEKMNDQIIGVVVAPK